MKPTMRLAMSGVFDYCSFGVYAEANEHDILQQIHTSLLCGRSRAGCSSRRYFPFEPSCRAAADSESIPYPISYPNSRGPRRLEDISQ